MCKSPDVPLQVELLTRTSQLRTGNVQCLQFKFGTYQNVMYYIIDQYSSSACKKSSVKNSQDNIKNPKLIGTYRKTSLYAVTFPDLLFSVC